MDSHQSLYRSLLAAIGVVSCAAGSSSTEPGTGQVVPIPSASNGVSTSEKDSAEPKRQWQKGFVTEADGTVHRAIAGTCDAAIDVPRCQGNEKRLACKQDSDCKVSPHGACMAGMGMDGSYCDCVYSCENDAECGPGNACVCKGTGGLKAAHSVCAMANCLTDADCGGSECGLSARSNGCAEEVRMACRTETDKCRTDADCRKNGINSAACAVQVFSKSDMRWGCDIANCVPGRALRVEGEVRVAASAARDDFRFPLDLDIRAHSPAEREKAARYYEMVAAFEHASVASFSRISLQLMAFGAPAALLTEASRAALDEIEHARMSYSLAERFSGEAKGPSALPEAMAPLAVSFDEFVRALVLEGCVGETLAAAEVREAARLAVDPGLRALLSRIADDEERHASFSWRTLVWALSRMGERGHEIISRAFSEAFAHYDMEVSGSDRGLEAVGILSGASMLLIRRNIFRNVIEPCIRHLPRRS